MNSGKIYQIALDDLQLARIAKRCRDLPGQELFQYVDEDRQTHSINSSDVNDYLRGITGEEYTAKDFRTLAGTMLAALALQEFEKFDSATQAKKISFALSTQWRIGSATRCPFVVNVMCIPQSWRFCGNGCSGMSARQVLITPFALHSDNTILPPPAPAHRAVTRQSQFAVMRRSDFRRPLTCV